VTSAFAPEKKSFVTKILPTEPLPSTEEAFPLCQRSQFSTAFAPLSIVGRAQSAARGIDDCPEIAGGTRDGSELRPKVVASGSGRLSRLERVRNS
jgi:hypothetical protein